MSGTTSFLSVATTTVYKIMLIGDMSVGKTCAIYRFCDGKYHTRKSTIECDIKTKTIDLDGDKILLEIWDTAGMERFNAVSNITYRKMKGILLMYDITRLVTFNSLKERIADIEENVSCDVVIVLVGNKFDAPETERQVSFEKGEELANELDIPFFEVSCKNNINIDEAFFTLTRNIKKQILKDKLIDDIRSLEEEMKIKESELLKIIKLEEEEKKKKNKRSFCNCNISNNNLFLRLA